MKKQLFTIFAILYIYPVFAQSVCFRVDSITGIAYDLTDSSLYSGSCSHGYKKGGLRYYCLYEDGVKKYSTRYNKKGTLVDSIIYLDGDKRYTEYKFSRKGVLRYSGTYYTSERDFMDVLENEGLHVKYDKEGNKNWETMYYNDSLYKKSFYKNGNLKSEGLYCKTDTVAGSLITLKPDGVHKFYREDGFLERTEKYIIETREKVVIYYNEDNTIKKKAVYIKGIKISD